MAEISVIIPVYNTEKYLRECLDSVINQTFKDFEIICVDDCSTDGSADILKEYANKYENFTFLAQNHNGAGEARNKGIDIAKGKYIIFIDSDDWLEIDMLEKMHKRAKKFDSDMVVCGLKTYNEETKRFEQDLKYCNIDFELTPLDKPFNYKDFPDYIFDMFGVAPWYCLYLTSVIKENNIRFQNLESCNDVAFGLIARVCAKRIVVFNEKLINHRINHIGCITSQRGNHAINIIKSYICVKDFLKKYNLYYQLKTALLRRILNSCIYEASCCNKEQYQKFLKELKEFLPQDWRKIAHLTKRNYLILDDLNELIASKKVMLWGASLFLKELLKEETMPNSNILGVIDKNPEFWGKTIGNYKIYSPKALKELKPEGVVLTVLNSNYKIYRELKVELETKYNNIELLDNIFEKYTEHNIEKNLSKEEYPDYLFAWYFKHTGEILDLENPKTFNEKIQWLKLYDSTPIKTKLADKYLVRNWVKEKIGEEYLIPLLGVWDRAEDIDFNKLPNQFVLKCNHGCGYNIIVKNKAELDIEETKLKLTMWLSENFAFKNGLELHYSDIPRKIIAEKYLKTPNNDLQDYKSLCFNGEVKYVWVDKGRYTNHKRNIYDINWIFQEDKQINTHYKHFKEHIKPLNYDKMIEFAKILSKGFLLARIDFYEHDNKLYFGEITFTSGSGVNILYPKSFDEELSRLIKLHQ